MRDWEMEARTGGACPHRASTSTGATASVLRGPGPSSWPSNLGNRFGRGPGWRGTWRRGATRSWGWTVRRPWPGSPKRPRQARLTSWPKRGRVLSPTQSFDLVVAYNSLMDVEDMPAAAAEAARVLSRPGRFCISVTHPFADTGEFVGEAPRPLHNDPPIFRAPPLRRNCSAGRPDHDFPRVGRTASRITRSPSKAPGWSSSSSGSRSRQARQRRQLERAPAPYVPST